MPGAKFVDQANHVLSVLARHEVWAQSQRELCEVTGVRPSLLSVVIKTLEEAGRVKRGDPLPGPGRQRTLIVLNAVPLSPDGDRGNGQRPVGTVPDLNGASPQSEAVFALVQEMADRLGEMAAEREAAGWRLRELREARDHHRAEVARLEHQVSNLEQEVVDLKWQGLQEGRSAIRRRSLTAIDTEAREMLEQVE